jgi:hypothetical protein
MSRRCHTRDGGCTIRDIRRMPAGKFFSLGLSGCFYTSIYLYRDIAVLGYLRNSEIQNHVSTSTLCVGYPLCLFDTFTFIYSMQKKKRRSPGAVVHVRNDPPRASGVRDSFMLVVEDVERVERVKEAAKAHVQTTLLLVFDDNKCTFRRGFPSFHHRVMGMAE